MGSISAVGTSVNPNGVYLDVNDIDRFPEKRPFH